MYDNVRDQQTHTHIALTQTEPSKPLRTAARHRQKVLEDNGQEPGRGSWGMGRELWGPRKSDELWYIKRLADKGSVTRRSQWPSSNTLL